MRGPTGAMVEDERLAVDAKVLEPYAGMRVLVVDDNPSNVTFLQLLLERQGLEAVYPQTDVRRLEHDLVTIRPDLVLLDLHMPYISGFDALPLIQKHAGGSFLPVLVLTGDATPVARNKALRLGAQDFLVKPLDAAETCLRIANLLRTKQLYGALRDAAPTAASRRQSARMIERNERLARVRSVLASGDITPHFQPVVDVQTLAIVGQEALARFSGLPLQTPDLWFADAFSVGLGTELEWLAAKNAVDLMPALTHDVFLAINMSPETVLALTEYALPDDVPYHRIVLELTEHVPVEDYPAIHRAIAPLVERGLRLAVDDVGAGYAGFRHLVRLRPDIIKLDISLVKGIHVSHEQRALARAMVTFAKDINARIIAEGVEGDDELDALRDLGVDWAQGYHLGRPAPMAMSACAQSSQP